LTGEKEYYFPLKLAYC